MTNNLDPQSPDPTSEAEAESKAAAESEAEAAAAQAASENESEAGAPEASPQNSGDEAVPVNNASDDQAAASSTSAAVAVAEKGPGGISPELLSDPYGEEILDISAADFEALLSDHADVMGDFREGEIVHAKVLRVTDSMVILEFGFKSEGAVPLDEF